MCMRRADALDTGLVRVVPLYTLMGRVRPVCVDDVATTTFFENARCQIRRVEYQLFTDLWPCATCSLTDRLVAIRHANSP